VEEGRDLRDPAQHHAPALQRLGQGAGALHLVTNAPTIINAFGDIDFVFGTKYDFKERFNGEPDYFANKGEQKGLLLDTNFVADAINLPLIAAKERGPAAGTSASAWRRAP
jgi:hypothetical protein